MKVSAILNIISMGTMAGLSSKEKIAGLKVANAKYPISRSDSRSIGTTVKG